MKDTVVEQLLYSLDTWNIMGLEFKSERELFESLAPNLYLQLEIAIEFPGVDIEIRKHDLQFKKGKKNLDIIRRLL